MRPEHSRWVPAAPGPLIGGRGCCNGCCETVAVFLAQRTHSCATDGVTEPHLVGMAAELGHEFLLDHLLRVLNLQADRRHCPEIFRLRGSTGVVGISAVSGG